MRPKHAALVMASLSFLFAGPALAIEPDSFMPPETAFVAQIRPKQLLRSSLFKEQGWDKALQTTFECVGPVAEFLETASLCFDRDLESILFCLPFTPLLQADTPDAVGIDQKTGEALRLDSKEWNPPWLLVVRGTFQPKKLSKRWKIMEKPTAPPFTNGRRASTDSWSWQLNTVRFLSHSIGQTQYLSPTGKSMCVPAW